MFIIAHHFITDPEGFWTGAPKLVSTLPSNFKVHSVFPSKDLKTGTCVWEADSVEDVQKMLDEATVDMAKNVCYEVNQDVAMGLPQKAMAEAVS